MPNSNIYLPILRNGNIEDVQAVINGRRVCMLGPAGPARELAITENIDAAIRENRARLPVLLGAGLGHALKSLVPYLKDNPRLSIAVVDKERELLELTRLKDAFSEFGERIAWIEEASPDKALDALTQWQMRRGGGPMLPISNPFYLRLDRDYYRKLHRSISASARFDFWAKARYRKFTNADGSSRVPRILLITSRYFLIGEIQDACRDLEIPFRTLTLENDEIAQEAFIEKLLAAVLEFKPDFAVTLNHLGVDKEGVLTDLLAKLELPLASWFVDNPHLILHRYANLSSPWTVIFTWDADNVASLRAMDFPHVVYLPLATTPERFAFARKGRHAPENDISFVGNSMVYKVGARMKAAAAPRELLSGYRGIAAGFAESEERSVIAHLESEHPELLPFYESLETAERKLAYETMITWEATRQYRAKCVEKILPFRPVIAGDSGWRITFKKNRFPWTYHPELNYYTELPRFYPLSRINFNCTSKQMKGAVNQRIFDVPATGSFVLTDWREQMEHLFEPGKEIAFYKDPAEIPELVSRYLRHPDERDKISLAARRRILQEHTYVHRIKTLVETMQKIFS